MKMAETVYILPDVRNEMQNVRPGKTPERTQACQKPKQDAMKGGQPFPRVSKKLFDTLFDAGLKNQSCIDMLQK